MLKETKVIKCSDCRKSLIEVLVPETNTNEVSNYFISANCPFCGGKSFKLGINKDMSYHASKNIVIQDVLTNDTNNTFILGKI